jgi:hypothetical protein
MSRLHAPEVNADVFCLANIAPAMSIGGTVVNPHLDPLRSALEEKGLRTLCCYYDSKDLVEANHALPAVSIEWTAEAARLSAQYRPWVQKQAREVLGPSFRLAKVEGLEISTDMPALVQRISLSLALRDIYTRIFEKNRSIRMLLLSNYYNPHGWAAIASARAAGILSADVQHGVQGSFHHAYGWPEASPKEWNVLPDLFLCWSKAEQYNLNSWQATRARSMEIGPGIYQLDRLFVDDPNLSPRMEAVAAEYRRQRRAVNLLLADERARGREVAGLFLQYVEDRDWVSALRAQLPAHVALWVRHHPGARRLTAVPVQSDDRGVTVIDEFPLAAIIESVDLVLTGYSSVGLEAAHLSRPVVAYSPLAEKFLEPICRATGFVKADSEPSPLASAILSTLRGLHAVSSSAPLPPIGQVADKLLSRASAMNRA